MSMSPKNENISNKKIFVGLSGGVDSAVSAALLKAQGYDVTGCFIKAWQPEWMRVAHPFTPCTWREERRDAMKICLALDIPFLFLDFEKEYKRAVVDKMLSEYKVGRTPNPDVLCNREIKFGIFLKKARESGADLIATGHYSQAQEVDKFNKLYKLKEGRDKEKDQSYFLWTLTQENLARTIFPVGGLQKSEVRQLAKKYNLPVAEKKDSQGICFMGDVEMGEFLSHYIETKPGQVFNAEGEVIGRHKGLSYYTIGERHGFEVIKKDASSGPFYIVAKDVKSNTIVVSDKESEILELSPTKIQLKEVNWINEPESEKLFARIRYRGEKISCKLILHGKKLMVEFARPVRGLSLGQSIVFYRDEECLGGAMMDKILA